MSAVVVIVVLLVVAMIVGPLAMMRPTPAQKRRDSLRLAARELGLGVGFKRLPARATDTAEPESVPVYSLQVKGGSHWLLVRSDYAHEMHLLQWWQPVGAPAPEAVTAYLREFLPKLPSDVAALGGQSSQLQVFWKERGDAEVVASIAEFLRGLAQAQGSPPVVEAR